MTLYQLSPPQDYPAKFNSHTLYLMELIAVALEVIAGDITARQERDDLMRECRRLMRDFRHANAAHDQAVGIHDRNCERNADDVTIDSSIAEVRLTAAAMLTARDALSAFVAAHSDVAGMAGAA